MAIVERDGVPGKICSRCGEWKPVMEFSILRVSVRRGGDGYLGRCKICDNAEKRARKRMTPEEWQAYRPKSPTVTERDGILGKICNKCGEWKSLNEYSVQSRNKQRGGDGFHYTCRICHSAARRIDRAANIEEHRAKQREYYRENSDKIKEKNSAYYYRNRERRKITDKIYREKNREQRNAYNRRISIAVRAADPEGVRAYHRSRYQVRKQTNPGKMRIQQREQENRRRARKFQAEGNHTEAEWLAVKERYRFTCLCCHRREPEIALTRDHVIPLVKHGSNYIYNIQPLCASCNSSKGVKTIDYRLDWVDPEN